MKGDAFDLETHCAQPGLVTPPIVCGSHATAKPGGERLLTAEAAVALLRQLLLSGEPIITANGPYDLGCAAALDPSLIPLIFAALDRDQIKDVLVREALQAIERGDLFKMPDGRPIDAYSLAICSETVLGEKLEKENTWRLRYNELDGIPQELWPEDAREYPRKDARTTLDVYAKQEERGGRNLALEGFENRANWALRLMSIWGMRTDPEMVAEVVADVTAKHVALLETYTKKGIYRGAGYCKNYATCPNGHSPHTAQATCQGARMVKGELKLPVWPAAKVGTADQTWLKFLVTKAYEGAPPTTETDRVSTDADTLRESCDDLLVKLGIQRKNEKEYATYLRVIQQGTKVPICPSTVLLVKTTRTAYYDPNLQNLPRGGRSRECFIPREFRNPDPEQRQVYCSNDFPSLELVTLGQTNLELFGWSEMAAALKRAEDLHCKLGAKFERVPYEDFRARYKAAGAREKNIRQASKPVNFGMAGGMGAQSLVVYARDPANGGVRFCVLNGAERCGVNKVIGKWGRAAGKPLCAACLEIATAFREAWFAMFPEMTLYFDRVEQEVGGRDNAAGGMIEVFGPKGMPSLWCGKKRFGDAANIRFQARAARLAKVAIARISKACYTQPESPLFGSRPVLFVHDESFMECPELQASAAAWEASRLMTEAAAEWCPDVPCRPIPALCRRWFKGAERVDDAQGSLVPWWPEKWNWAPDLPLMELDRARSIRH